MSTERLYIVEPYLREFSARVVARDTIGGKPAVALDRTAFYPTGGGQPNDLGRIAGVAVEEVEGTTRILDGLVADDWGDDFVVAPPGHELTLRDFHPELFAGGDGERGGSPALVEEPA